MKHEDGPKLRPWECRKLTMAEICFWMDRVGETTKSGGTPMSDEEIRDYCRYYFSLTPQQKLNAAREGQLL